MTADGVWLYAVRDEDGETYSTYGTWDHTHFSSAEEALGVWGHVDGATVVRRWVPNPLPWEVAP